jgi:hypothetical protein
MRKATVLLALVLLAILGAMAATPLLEQPPALRSSNAPGQFDAARAKERLAYILGDQQPHPADTPASDLVRARLVAQLQEIGLAPTVRDQFACNELFKVRGVSCARVRNVIAILGPPTGKALLLNAHYDSVPGGPGASDDGIGVATLLEVGSILKDRPLKRPVILLFNEGEELGLVGARAFLADPLSRNVDSLINLEARGVRGPVNMFETSRPNAAPIKLYRVAIEHPVANSLSTDVYRLLPNYTDVNSFAERGWLTLNLAPIGNETRYHSPGDDVATLDPATLQHMGDQTLALAESLAGGTPKASDGDKIFMDVTGRGLITLPLVVGAGLLIGLLIGFAILSLRGGEMLRGLAVSFGTLVGSGVLAGIALWLIGLVRSGMFWRAEPIWTHLATYASTIFVAVLLLATVGGSVELRQLRQTYWLLFLVVGGMIGLFAPGGIIFFIFPPLMALVGILLGRRCQRAESIGAALAILALYLTWGGMLGLLGELLDNGPMWVFAPLGSLLLLPVLIEAKPLIECCGMRSAACVAGVLALFGWGAVIAAPAYSADRQQRFVIEHVTDAATRKSWWSVLNDGAPLPQSFGRSWKRRELPFSERKRWLLPAPADPNATAPAVQLISDVRAGDERTLTLRLVANGNEDLALVAPANAKIRSAGAAGFIRPIDPNLDGRYSIGCSGRSCDGALLQLTIDQVEPIKFVILGSKAPLPPSAVTLLAARPKFARPQYNRDESIVFVVERL